MSEPTPDPPEADVPPEDDLEDGMERSPTWRPIEPDEPAEEEPPPTTSAGSANQGPDVLRLAVAGLAGATALVAAGLLLWAGTPQSQVLLGSDGEPGATVLEPSDSPQPRESTVASGELLVDVQGAVMRPGLHRLAPGSRLGDAIAAAGGYGPQVDIAAAAERLNLAEKLNDGAKIYVPARGDPTPAAIATAAPGGGTAAEGDGGLAGGGLIDVNTASEAQLDTLPGIGPVTAAKIIAAREEMPFATVDELLARKVVGPATFEKIRTLISVSP